MFRNALFIIVTATLLAACTKVIPAEKYIDAMVALGCHQGLMETMPAAQTVMEEKGVTLQDVQTFRKKMDPKQAMAIAQQIAQRVAACHGVSLPAGEGQP